MSHFYLVCLFSLVSQKNYQKIKNFRWCPFLEKMGHQQNGTQTKVSHLRLLKQYSEIGISKRFQNERSPAGVLFWYLKWSVIICFIWSWKVSKSQYNPVRKSKLGSQTQEWAAHHGQVNVCTICPFSLVFEIFSLLCFSWQRRKWENDFMKNVKTCSRRGLLR